MLTDELQLSLRALTEQIVHLLRTAEPELKPSTRENLRRTRSTALVVLGEAREIMEAREQRAITLHEPEPAWFPSAHLQDNIRARARRRRHQADPFGPRGPRL